MIKKIRNSSDYYIQRLLNDSKKDYPNLYEYLIKFEPLQVLDLGCGVPDNLFVLYHEFKCKLLQGVDMCSEDSIVSDYINKMKYYIADDEKLKLEKCKTFYDVYNWRIIEGSESIPKIEDVNLFNKIFLDKFNPPKSIQVFLKENFSKFHLIIASNILHFYNNDELDVLLQQIKDRLYAEGLFILRVEEKDNYGSAFNHIVFNKLLEKYFQNGDLYEYYVDNKWTYSIYVSISNLILKNS